MKTAAKNHREAVADEKRLRDEIARVASLDAQLQETAARVSTLQHDRANLLGRALIAGQDPDTTQIDADIIKAESEAAASRDRATAAHRALTILQQQAEAAKARKEAAHKALMTAIKDNYQARITRHEDEARAAAEKFAEAVGKWRGIVEGVRDQFGNTVIPDALLRPYEMAEIPDCRTQYPGIWVNFDIVGMGKKVASATAEAVAKEISEAMA